MTEREVSAQTTGGTDSEQPEGSSEAVINEFVTETKITQKEFAFSTEPSSGILRKRTSSRDRDKNVDAVAGAFRQIMSWVEKFDENEWELENFDIDTTIVVKRSHKKDE